MKIGDGKNKSCSFYGLQANKVVKILAKIIRKQSKLSCGIFRNI